MGVTTDFDERPPTPTLSLRQAAFIGVGAMVGAGIFALLGSGGEVADIADLTWKRARQRRRVSGVRLMTAGSSTWSMV